MKKIPVRQIAKNKIGEPSTEKFSIRDVKEVLGEKDLFHDLHRHNFFFILVLKNGEGSHEIDFVNHIISNNSIFFLRPGQVHQLMLKAGATGYILEFNADFYQPTSKLSMQRFRKASNKNFCALEMDGVDKLHSILSHILNEYHERKESYQDAIKANLEIFFIELVRQSKHPQTLSNPGSTYAQERLEEFLELLELHFTSHKQVFHYTALMNLSSYQLNEITKATISKTASEIINNHLILEAKRYLLATTNQIKDIADQLGYEDVSYFIRFFKKHTGYSPETFRQNSL